MGGYNKTLQLTKEKEEANKAEALDLLNTLLPLMPDYDEFDFDDFIGPRNAYGTSKEMQVSISRLANYMNKLIVNYGFATWNSSNFSYTLTDKGRAVKMIGGHDKYLLKQEEDRKRKARKEQLDLINAENLRKSYRLTRFLAWLGAVSGIISLCIALLKMTKFLGEN